MLKKFIIIALFALGSAQTTKTTVTFTPWVSLGLVAGGLANSAIVNKSVNYLEQQNYITTKTASHIKTFAKARFVLLGIYAATRLIHSHSGLRSCIACCPESSLIGFLMGLLPLPEIGLITSVYEKLISNL